MDTGTRGNLRHGDVTRAQGEQVILELLSDEDHSVASRQTRAQPEKTDSMQIEEIVTRKPVLPVLILHKLEHAVPLARALVAGGIEVIEVTMRTPIALNAVEAIAKSVPEALIGVGTLTRPEQFVQAADAGAQFAVSPGLTRVLLNASQQVDMPYLPGVFTPSEAMTARDMGFQYLKLFPAAQCGGVGMLKALASPFSDLHFSPTGGINETNFREYLALPNVVSVGGDWMAPNDALEAGDWERVEQLSREAVS